MKYLFRKFTQFAKLLPRMVIERPVRRLTASRANIQSIFTTTEPIEP